MRGSLTKEISQRQHQFAVDLCLLCVKRAAIWKISHKLRSGVPTPGCSESIYRVNSGNVSTFGVGAHHYTFLWCPSSKCKLVYWWLLIAHNSTVIEHKTLGPALLCQNSWEWRLQAEYLNQLYSKKQNYFYFLRYWWQDQIMPLQKQSIDQKTLPPRIVKQPGTLIMSTIKQHPDIWRTNESENYL